MRERQGEGEAGTSPMGEHTMRPTLEQGVTVRDEVDLVSLASVIEEKKTEK